MKYRSKLEERLGNGRLKHLQYEGTNLAYTQTKSYIPDFINNKKKILFEVKGYFRDSREARKYVDVKEQYPEWAIVVVFSDPTKPLAWAKKRVGDGKRLTHGEWAENHGFEYCTEHSIKKEWL